MRELTRLVDLPELVEASDLTLVVTPGPRERREAGCRHVGGVDLDERVDEVVAEKASRRLAFEPRRQLVRRYVAVEVVHDVERDAEDALVLADRDDRRQAREAGLTQRELEPSLPNHIVRGRWQRWTRRTPKDEAALVALEQKREVRAAPFSDAARAQCARPKIVLVEERTHAVEHEQRWLHQAFRVGRGLDDVAPRRHRAILCRSCVAGST